MNFKIYLLAVALLFTAFSTSVHAQTTFLAGQFFENQYIGNPAMAGLEQGITLNLSYRNQWRSMPGSPLTQSFSAEYGNEKVGAGLNIYNDKAGLNNRLRAVGSYAFHVPLNDESQQLHFGVSLGVSKASLNTSGVIGDEGDVSIDDYKRKPYLVADFGMAYTNEDWTLQMALPNMKKYFEKDDREIIDRASFLLAASYKINLALEGIYLEPRVGYRGAKGIDGIVDIGTSVGFRDNVFRAMGMYHSNKSYTLGFGVHLDERYSINGYFSNQWTDLSTPMGGNFEIGIRANVWQLF